MTHPSGPLKIAITANVIAAWLCTLVAGFYAIAWLVPPGQDISPMDLRPINPAIASVTALLWSLNALLLVLPTFGSRTVPFRVASIAAPVLAVAVALVVYVRA